MKTILVADDESAIREFVYDLLTSKGFQAITATSGAQMLDLLKSRNLQAIKLLIPFSI